MKSFARSCVHFLVPLSKILISCHPSPLGLSPRGESDIHVGKTKYDKVMTHKTISCQLVFSFGHIYFIYPGNSFESPGMSGPIAVCFAVKLCWSLSVLIYWLIVYSTLFRSIKKGGMPSEELRTLL